jgi:hypothetical protein
MYHLVCGALASKPDAPGQSSPAHALSPGLVTRGLRERAGEGKLRSLLVKSNRSYSVRCGHGAAATSCASTDRRFVTPKVGVNRVCNTTVLILCRDAKHRVSKESPEGAAVGALPSVLRHASLRRHSSGRGWQGVRPLQAQPSKSKPGQAHPNKIAWICVVLFVRIGTYQWVTAISNKNFLLSPRLIAKARPSGRALVF